MGKKAQQRRRAHKQRMKAQQEAVDRREQESQKPVDWRMEGLSEDPRFESVAQAERARARVQRMKPRPTKGKKQMGRRPSFITAERIHHSRGKKWEEFVAEEGIEDLSELEQRQYFDSFACGGQELFQKWKQQQYDSRVVVNTVRILEYGDGRRMVVVKDPETGELKQVPYVDPEEKKKPKPVSRSRTKAKHCSQCGMRIATSRTHLNKCSTCQPASMALAAFKAAVKKSSQEASK